MSGGIKADAQRDEYALVQSYLKFTKNALMTQRNAQLIAQILASKESRPQDIAHLYHAQLQCTRAMLGVKEVEDDDLLGFKLSAEEVLYRGYRAYYSADTYLGEKKVRHIANDPKNSSLTCSGLKRWRSLSTVWSCPFKLERK
jgi:hypothetical protein